MLPFIAYRGSGSPPLAPAWLPGLGEWFPRSQGGNAPSTHRGPPTE